MNRGDCQKQGAMELSSRGEQNVTDDLHDNHLIHYTVVVNTMLLPGSITHAVVLNMTVAVVPFGGGSMPLS